MDEALLLARVQFGLNIAFHILFPSITIGLAWILVVFRLRYERTRDPAWLEAYKLWVKVFALSFAMGVVSGITMSFQFGTNWPGYMNKVGNIAGPLLAYEVLTAFFLEATFLGVMLFGMSRVSGRVHLLSSVVVAAGTMLSAFWILALNSWMQTPAGHVVQDGVLVAGSWLEVIFNPSFPYRLVHMLLASALTAAFLIAGLSAWRLLKAAGDASARKTLRFAVRLAAMLVPVQIVVGDLHGLNTLKHQPAKIAAVEALWETQRGAPLTLFAIIDEDEKRNDYAIEIPKALSVILTHDPDGVVRGLEEFGNDYPPVASVFWSFRIMVAIGVLMLALSWTGLFVLRSATPRWLLWSFAGFTFSGWIATLAGWMVTEIGRQPWLVTGILRTAEAVGEAGGAELGASLTAYALTYAALLLSYMVVLTHLAGKGAAS
ncbi:MAG TPA: cytochrome ubiquinol oxidase subunit I [Burkholderiales bacterium]|nr:cytochrome ubiquinol oxidase subunit I [Burkholderiales bacterium]